MSEVEDLRVELAKAHQAFKEGSAAVSRLTNEVCLLQAEMSHLMKDNTYLRETLAAVRAESDQRVQAEADQWQRYVDNAEMRRNEAHAKAEQLRADVSAVTAARDLLWQEVAALLKAPESAPIFDEDGKFHGFEYGGRDKHRTVGPHRARSIDAEEWCYPSLPCSMCCPAVDASDLREILDRHA